MSSSFHVYVSECSLLLTFAHPLPRIPVRLVFFSSSHRGIRHYWGVRVRGQHTKTTGRRGKIVAAGGRK